MIGALSKIFLRILFEVNFFKLANCDSCGQFKKVIAEYVNGKKCDPSTSTRCSFLKKNLTGYVTNLMSLTSVSIINNKC